jgi:ABC-type glutathione transport system ATPase component
MERGKEQREREAEELLECRSLRLGYRREGGWKAVVHGVDLSIRRGETAALVGESGSGKSTIAKALVKLIPVLEGTVRVDGEDVSRLDRRGFAPFRKRIQLVFQDPWQALNPHLTVGELLEEPLRLHFRGQTRRERQERIAGLLEAVHLPTDVIGRYPAAFSGGQRQRILIARALAVEPELLICDEPVSALDVSTQARLLELLRELKQERGLTLLFISHDLAVVQEVADEVYVLCEGRMVEHQSAAELFRDPGHPYTKALIEACPQW